MVRLHVLGATASNGSMQEPLRSVCAQPKRTGLLVYLAIAGARGLCRRDTLLAHFWPELDRTHARAQLRKQLHSLRSLLGHTAFLSGADGEVAVNPESVWCDVAAFDDAVARGELETALELYRGDLLEGFHVDDASGFERWLDDERVRLRGIAKSCAWGLVERDAEAGRTAQAAHWARRAVVLDPLDEVGVRRLMELLIGSDDPSGAVRMFEAFSERLRHELELEPSRETRALMTKARRAAVEGASPPNSREPVAAARTAVPADATRPRFTTRPTAVLIAAVSVLGVSAVTLTTLSPRQEVWNDRGQRIAVVGPFVNRTGDSSLDVVGEMMTDWVARVMIRSGLVGVTRLSNTPTASARPDGELIVSGAYYRDGDRVRLRASVSSVHDRKLLRSVDQGVADGADAGAAVDTLSQRIVAALATVVDERLSAWSQAASLPPSVDAYRLYAEGLGVFLRAPQTGRVREERLRAGRLLQQAWSLDTTFTAPLIWAVYSLRVVAPRSADSIYRYLEDRLDRLEPWDAAMARYLLAERRRDWGSAVHAAHEVLRYAPASEWAYKLALAAVWGGQPREAINALTRIDPSDGWLAAMATGYWTTLAEAWHQVGHYAMERQTLDRAATHVSPARLRAGFLRVHAALATLDTSALATDTLVADALSTAELAALSHALDELATHGYEGTAARLAARMVPRFHALNAREREQWSDVYVNVLLRAGQLRDADRVLEGIARVDQMGSFERTYALGQRAVIAARLGERARAEEIARRLAALATSESACLLYQARDSSDVCQIDRLFWLAIVGGELHGRARGLMLLAAASRQGYTYPHLHSQWGADSVRVQPPTRTFATVSQAGSR